MSDLKTPTPEQPTDPVIPKRWRTVITILTILMCAGSIGFLLFYGKADNSLHQSALSWSYTLIGVILLGIGFQAAVPFLAGRK